MSGDIHETGLYREGSSILYRLNPLTKLVLALCFSIAAFAADGVWMLAALLVACLLLLALARSLRRVMRVTYRYLLFFCVALFTVQALFWSGGGPTWEAGGLEIHLQGVLYAVQVTLRLLVLLCAWYLLITTTRPLDLVMDLEQRGLPPRLGYVTLATLQATGELQERARQILEAQQCRGVEVQGGLIVRARAYLPAVAPLITSSILGIESRAAALELRGFSANSPKTILYKSEEQTWERWARWAFILLAAATLAARLAC